jgi:hypothetical protein
MRTSGRPSPTSTPICASKGSRVTVDVTRGACSAPAWARTTWKMPDMREHPATVKVDGEVDGPQRVPGVPRAQSRGANGSITGRTRASHGNGHLALKFGSARAGHVKSLAGEYQSSTTSYAGPARRRLAQINGKLYIQRPRRAGPRHPAEAFGGPLKLRCRRRRAERARHCQRTANVAAAGASVDVRRWSIA